MNPSFVLAGPTGTVLAEGMRAGFSDITEAQAALRAGTPIVLGALPFDLTTAAALYEPETVQFTGALPDWDLGPAPAVLDRETLPPGPVHRERVAEAVRRLCDEQNPIDKVVLARAVRLTAESPWDPRTVLRRLADADPAATVYLADLSPAGGAHTGTALVGASPELLVAREGEVVICQPFAGSAPRSADPQTDAANAAALAASAKNRHEHQLVVDVMRKALDPLCADLQIAEEPELHGTDALWHLSTPIRGLLREKQTTAIDLALALHPTPAVGGVPTDLAAELIGELEGDRGFYAGAVGWCDSHGDGRWVVSIRCAVLSPDRRTALATAGGGIVAASDPDDEVDETTTKFKTILTGLGAT
ncbi:isochorismate synthase [Mycobacterium frederiksbergense]|uniref:isochorismate synthase n=1 Tax=Mycolicibacterium frederiksbergense TaxID=117567 RepID=A0ABT6L3X4_9MYCO|nr:isochorismate synthase [Mycolicibacterium frederiksbergense]MDH6196700.1 isochorismate synthase [Mycolicibacterium frederiksbergense]